MRNPLWLIVAALALVGCDQSNPPLVVPKAPVEAQQPIIIIVPAGETEPKQPTMEEQIQAAEAAQKAQEAKDRAAWEQRQFERELLWRLDKR